MAEFPKGEGSWAVDLEEEIRQLSEQSYQLEAELKEIEAELNLRAEATNNRIEQANELFRTVCADIWKKMQMGLVKSRFDENGKWQILDFQETKEPLDEIPPLIIKMVQEVAKQKSKFVNELSDQAAAVLGLEKTAEQNPEKSPEQNPN